MAAAKLQTRAVRSVNGHVPVLRVAVQAFFSPHFRWAIEDPEDEPGGSSGHLLFDVELALEMYYSAAIAAVAEGQSRRILQRDFLVRALPEIGVTVGLDRSVHDRIRRRSMLAAGERPAFEAPPELGSDGDFVVFADGLAIALDSRWAEERMALEPWARRNA